MKPAVVAAVIGDVVGSRTTPDRPALHDRLHEVLEQANQALRPVVPLRITVGDEYQGCFATLGEAVHATLWLRLALAPATDVRHGIGWGEVSVLADEPRVEDGPGWWAARDAIDAVKDDASRAATRELRTAYHRAGEEGPDPAAVNAALICRDHLVGSAAMKGDGRALRLLRGVLAGRTQAELAAEEGVSASAVSQRMRADGLSIVVAADRLLQDVR
jgi:hypothetical protein